MQIYRVVRIRKFGRPPIASKAQQLQSTFSQIWMFRETIVKQGEYQEFGLNDPKNAVND